MEISSTVLVCDFDYAIHHLPKLSFRAGFKLGRIELALVKPNFCGFKFPSLDLLVSVFDFLLSESDSVVVGETPSGMYNPQGQFEKLGLNSVLERFRGRVMALDLSEGEGIRVRVPKPHVLESIDFPKMVFKADVLINVPRVNTHPSTSLTCALKNLFGLLPEKRKSKVFHPLGMDRVVADIAQVVKPDLNVADAGEKVILGVDPLAVDVVACRFLDLDPFEVEHLNLVSEDRGEKLEDFMEKMEVIEV